MPVAIRVGLWLTFFVFLNKYRKMQINYTSLLNIS